MKSLSNILLSAISTMTHTCGALQAAKDPREALDNFDDIDDLADAIVEDFSDAIRDALADTELARFFEAFEDAQYSSDFDDSDYYEDDEMYDAKRESFKTGLEEAQKRAEQDKKYEESQKAQMEDLDEQLDEEDDLLDDWDEDIDGELLTDEEIAIEREKFGE